MRRALVATALTALVSGAVVATSSSAPAADSSYPIPSSGTIAMSGHGFGHGHGLSQYGAQGAARSGRTYAQILAFYYPGTKIAAKSGKIRALVTADTTDDVVVAARSGLYVRDLGDGTNFTLPALAGVTRWRITQVPSHKQLSKVQYLSSRGWRRYPLPGRKRFVGDAQFASPGSLRLVLPGGSSRVYRGKLRSASPTSSSSTRATVNVTTLDKYVKGVIPAEMPSSWAAEALKSQAVAARTYAAYEQAVNASRYYQICDTTACQVYGGRSRETTATNRAVDATAAKILTYRKKPAFTQFSASSGGWTAAGSAPYLVAKADPYDSWSGNSVHLWTKKLTASSLRSAYPLLGRPTRIQVLTRDGHGDWGGRVRTVRLTGSKGSVTISGETMRSRFGLRSTWFHLG